MKEKKNGQFDMMTNSPKKKSSQNIAKEYPIINISKKIDPLLFSFVI
jgi:hypothetical protein